MQETSPVRQDPRENAELQEDELTFTPSAHLYSYFGPADMHGHVSGVQNSVSVLYRRFTAL